MVMATPVTAAMRMTSTTAKRRNIPGRELITGMVSIRCTKPRKPSSTRPTVFATRMKPYVVVNQSDHSTRTAALMRPEIAMTMSANSATLE